MKCKRNRVYRQQLCFFWFVLSPPNFGRFFWKHMWASYLHSYSPIMSWLLRLAYACMRVHAGRRPTQNLPRFLCMASFDQSGSFSLFRNQYSSLWNLGLCVVSRLVRSQDSKIATSVLFPLGHFLSHPPLPCFLFSGFFFAKFQIYTICPRFAHTRIKKFSW